MVFFASSHACWNFSEETSIVRTLGYGGTGEGAGAGGAGAGAEAAPFAFEDSDVDGVPRRFSRVTPLAM